MADEKRFSHITVNANEDDDVVIQAGAYAPAAQTNAQTWEQPQPDQAHYGEPEHAAQAQPSQEERAEHVDAQPDSNPVADCASAPAKASASDHHSQHKEYHEQTLEDLDAGPMSKMQKIVLACVAVLIVGFAAYYLVFMH